MKPVLLQHTRPLELNGTGNVLRHPEEDTEERFRPSLEVARFDSSAVDLGTNREVVRRFNLAPVVHAELQRIQAGISPLGYVGDDVPKRLRELIALVEGFSR